MQLKHRNGGAATLSGAMVYIKTKPTLKDVTTATGTAGSAGTRV